MRQPITHYFKICTGKILIGSHATPRIIHDLNSSVINKFQDMNIYKVSGWIREYLNAVFQLGYWAYSIRCRSNSTSISVECEGASTRNKSSNAIVVPGLVPDLAVKDIE